MKRERLTPKPPTKPEPDDEPVREKFGDPRKATKAAAAKRARLRTLRAEDNKAKIEAAKASVSQASAELGAGEPKKKKLYGVAAKAAVGIYMGGKPKGTPNKIPQRVIEAIATACEMAGSNGAGKDGMAGYMFRLAMNEPRVMGGLLMKIIPHRIQAKTDIDPQSVVGQLLEATRSRLQFEKARTINATTLLPPPKDTT